jgi:hypothetical protein
MVPSGSVIVGRVSRGRQHRAFDDGGRGPGARVYLEDGTFTLTDVVGKYHVERSGRACTSSRWMPPTLQG